MQGKGKKPGFYGDEDDRETSSYFNTGLPNSSTAGNLPGGGAMPPPPPGGAGANMPPGGGGGAMFRGDLLASSSSPSHQLSGFYGPAALYQQQQQALVRGFPAAAGNGPPPFAKGAPSGQVVTQQPPMSFAMPPTQQHSPNRGMLGNAFHRPFPMSQPMSAALPGKRGPAGTVSTGIGSQSAFNYSQSLRDLTSQPNLDNLSEFPSLSQRSSSSPMNAGGARNYGSLRDHLSMSGMNKGEGAGGRGARDVDNEFSMRHEDFPALPGAENSTPTTSGVTTSGSSATEGEAQKQMTMPPLLPLPPANANSTPQESSATFSRSTKENEIVFAPNGTVNNIPPGMIRDQFGMVGLLAFVRAMESNTNLVALAPGIELTSLGLNLNAAEELFKTFQSPYAEGPCRPQDIDYNVPTEYMTNIFIKDKLCPMKLEQYGEDLLFFLFYSSPGDVLQLLVSSELYRRQWRYHKEENVWITWAQGAEPDLKTSSYEKGTYWAFDLTTWRRTPKYFHLEYNKLEDKPLTAGNPTVPVATIPPNNPLQQQQPVGVKYPGQV